MQKNGKRATTIMESIDGYSEVYGKSTQDREDFEASNMGLICLPSLYKKCSLCLLSIHKYPVSYTGKVNFIQIQSSLPSN